MASWAANLDLTWAEADFTWASLDGIVSVEPDPSDVRAGVVYVVDGIEYIGTYVGGGSIPDDPALCRLTIKLTNVHGSPMVGANVSPVLPDSPVRIAGGFVLDDQLTSTADDSGNVTMDLVRAIVVTLLIESHGRFVRRAIEVPDEASATIEVTA